MLFRRHMKQNAIKPIWWSPESELKSARYTRIFRLCLLIALLTLTLSGCSKAVSIVPIQPLPANLSSDCHPVPNPPEPLIDPDRAIWEVEIIAKYSDCALKHRMTVSSWPKK